MKNKIKKLVCITILSVAQLWAPEGTSSEKISLTSLDGSVETIPYHTGLTVAEVERILLSKSKKDKVSICDGKNRLNPDTILNPEVHYSVIYVDLRLALANHLLDLIKAAVSKILTDPLSAGSRELHESIMSHIQALTLQIQEGSSICVKAVWRETRMTKSGEHGIEISINTDTLDDKTIGILYLGLSQAGWSIYCTFPRFPGLLVYTQPSPEFQTLVDMIAPFLPAAVPFSTSAQGESSLSEPLLPDPDGRDYFYC